MAMHSGSADLFGERDEVQGARRAELCMAIPLGGKPPSGWSSETYHEDRRAFEHRASATELGKRSLLSELPAFGTQQFARAANKSVLP
jgi:hypothetical protein